MRAAAFKPSMQRSAPTSRSTAARASCRSTAPSSAGATAAPTPRAQQLAAWGAAVLVVMSSGAPAVASTDVQRNKLAAAEEQFQQSETLKMLKERSEANRAKNKKEIQNKYCSRQAELGIGDCGGLRYIPGMTKSGKQKTPEWLANMLGVENPPAPPELQGKTLADLLGPVE